MKKISLFLAGCLFLLSASAQQYNNTVTITVNGSISPQITLDGKNYSLNSSTQTAGKTTITVNDLNLGQHTFQFNRSYQNTSNSERISTIFNLRSGYNMHINVTSNGSLELIEKMNNGMVSNGTPVTNAVFATLLRNVRAQTSVNNRRTVIANALNNQNYYFTTLQVRQLLQQVNSESYRLELAKMSYSRVTDRDNFHQLYNSLNSQAGRKELEEYVNNYQDNNYPYTAAMSDSDFNTIYQNARQQWPAASRLTSLTNTFNNTTYYFTTAQAKQLIELANNESSRLQLARLSYRSITDPGNFIQLNSLFNTQVSRDNLAAYVAGYKNETVQHTAMPEASYTSLYQTIQQQWPVGTQVNSLAAAFGNNGHYFTTYQAKHLIQLIPDENSRLQLAKQSYRSITDPVRFSDMHSLFNKQASKDNLTAYVASYKNETGQYTAMQDASYTSLYQTVQQQWPVATQVSSITSAFNNTSNYFTTYQARQLIQIINDENTRLQLAKQSYRSITDPVRFSDMYSLFNNTANRTDLVNYVNNYQGGVYTENAMSDTDFTTLYQSIERQFMPNEQMNTLTTLFNSTGNYFATSQARKLIQLVSYESNRLQLAKLSYRTITDRNNFNQLYDLFENQSYRNELDAYAKAYND